MAKRIFKRDMDAYDKHNGESNVRELEMLVDAVAPEAGYVIQFWRDMDTYGLREAVMYVENIPDRRKPKPDDVQRLQDFVRVFTQKFNSSQAIKAHAAECIRATFRNMEDA